MRSKIWMAAALLLGLAACAPAKHEARELTEHQRDSVLAQSGLPGAFVVGRALAVSQRAAVRAARQDSLTR